MNPTKKPTVKYLLTYNYKLRKLLMNFIPNQSISVKSIAMDDNGVLLLYEE